MHGDDLTAYQIDDVPSVEINAALKQMLLDKSADNEQISLMSEAVILVDEDDNQIGQASKVAAHHGAGLLHRAFSVLLFDRNKRLLLQKRAEDKVTFPGVWANSCCSHPLSSPEESELENSLGSEACSYPKIASRAWNRS